jgi:hypothetical protein
LKKITSGFILVLLLLPCFAESTPAAGLYLLQSTFSNATDSLTLTGLGTLIKTGDGRTLFMTAAHIGCGESLKVSPDGGATWMLVPVLKAVCLYSEDIAAVEIDRGFSNGHLSTRFEFVLLDKTRPVAGLAMTETELRTHFDLQATSYSQDFYFLVPKGFPTNPFRFNPLVIPQWSQLSDPENCLVPRSASFANEIEFCGAVAPGMCRISSQ